MAINFIKRGNTNLKEFTSKEEMINSGGNRNENIAVVYNKDTKTLDGIYQYIDSDTFDVTINGEINKVSKELFNNFKYLLVYRLSLDNNGIRHVVGSPDTEITVTGGSIKCNGNLYRCEVKDKTQSGFEGYPFLEDISYTNFSYLGNNYSYSYGTNGVVCYSNYDVKNRTGEVVHSSDYEEPWQLIETQLDAINTDIVKDKKVYSKDGVITGSLQTASGISRDTIEIIDQGADALGRKRLVMNAINSGDFYLEPNGEISLNTLQKNIATAINLTANKIKQGEKVLDISGSVKELKGQPKTITPSITEQTITPDSGYNAITEVTVPAVTSSIDTNIQPENIKKGVTILGIVGTFE